MINTHDNFTGDVVALLLHGGQARQVRHSLRMIDGDRLPEAIKDCLIEVMSPLMQACPPFVQQICARVLVEHVDWQAVADAVLADPEMN